MDKYKGNCCIYGIISIFVAILLLGIMIYTFKDSIYNRLILGDSESLYEPTNYSKSVLKIAIASDIESDLDAFDRFLSGLSLSEIDAVFIIGDITTLGVKEDMDKIKDVSEKYDIPIDFVPGDRDLWKNDLVNFSETFGDAYYVKEIDGHKILLIDNSDEYKGISDDQFTFIEDNIASTDFVLLHNPIYFEGSIFSSFLHKGMGQYSADVDKQRIRLLDLVRNSDVKAVIAGDLHLFTEQNDKSDRSLNHFTVGSLNRSRSIDSSSYAILEIYEDGKYSVTKQYIND